MKNLTTISILAIAAILSACDKTGQANQKTSVSVSSTFEMKVVNWGPQLLKAGINPNKQPDGSMGIWIEVESTKGLGEAQLMFGGQPAKVTSVQEKIITAAVDANQIATAGDKEVVIRQIESGKLLPVGTVRVSSL
jgi:hypothetical protein